MKRILGNVIDVILPTPLLDPDVHRVWAGREDVKGGVIVMKIVMMGKMISVFPSPNVRSSPQEITRNHLHAYPKPKLMETQPKTLLVRQLRGALSKWIESLPNV